MLGLFCHSPSKARTRTHARTYFPFLSALATRKKASPIGLLSVFGCLLFALLTATQERKCPKTAVAAADIQGHEGWVGTGWSAQWMLRRRRIKKTDTSPFVTVMGVSLICNWHNFIDTCFITNSSPSACSLMRLMKSVYSSAASQA